MYLIVFIFANILTTVTVTGADTGLNLLCTNDYDELMSCNFYAQNCSEYRMTLINQYATERCSFSPCDTGCCCSIKMILVLTDYFTANVLKGNQSVESKQISIEGSIKPVTPSIVSVKKFKRNFEIQWKTNVVSVTILDYLKAVVTYWKKGTNETKTENVTANIIHDLSFCEIHGEDLEPSTTYVVSVKTYTTLSGIFSDSSNEWEFTTPVSSFSLKMAVISGLSIAAAIISCVIFGCYVKPKTIWEERAAKCQKTKIIPIQAKTEEIVSSVLPLDFFCVEPDAPDRGKTGLQESLTYSSGGSPNSSGITTDMSYQCNSADSGGSSYAEDSSQSCLSSETDTTVSWGSQCDNCNEL